MPMTAVLVFVCLVVAVLLGRSMGGRLSEHHLTDSTRDTIKLSLGLVATLSALLLGLLVSSAKGAYDAQRQQIDELAAKIATLDRVLSLYGAQSAVARRELHATVENAIARVWPQQPGASSDLTPDVRSGDAIHRAVQLLVSRGLVGVSVPLLVIVVSWLVLILFGFSMLAPRNAVATVALIVAAAAVSAAILLMLEFYEPFDGLIQISSEPMVEAISRISN